DVVALRGTLSGEHGIGVLKAPYLSLEQSPDLINLQKNLKQVFDPKGLLNPGKIFTTGSHGSCELETIEAQQARTHAMIVALGLSWVGVGLLYAAIPARRPEPARSLAFLPPWTVRG